MREHLYDPARWRKRAEELRSIAETLTDAAPRTSLLQLVADYLRLAERSEARRKDRDPDDAG